MSVGLYMDVQVSSAITKALRRRGVDVLTAQEDGAERFPDDILLDRAGELGRVLFTRDADFLVITALRQQQSEPFGGVVYAHQLRVSVGQCVEDSELIAMCSDADKFAGRLERLPLR